MLSRYQRNRLLLLAAATASYVLFWLAGRAFDIPHHPGYEVSLALQPSAASGLLLTAAVLLICTAVSTAIAGTVRFDAGLFAASIGLMALSVRGGPIRYVLQEAKGAGIFITLAAEAAVLFGFLGLAWWGQWLLYRRGRLQGDALRDGLEDREHTLNHRLVAAATQAGVMAVLILLLARSDDKKQVLAAVGTASFLATLLAYAMSPVRPSAWYWVGPLVVAWIGYGWGCLSWSLGAQEAWRTGLGSGLLAPLARPLPLDYASLGPAGAILGYWMSRRWHQAKEAETGSGAATSTEALPTSKS